RQTQEEPANCRPPKRVLGTEVQAARCLAEQARKGGIAARCAPAYNSRAAKECPKSGEPAAPYTARPVDEEISPIFYGNKQPGHRASGTFTEVRCRGHDHEAPQRCSRTGFQPANGKQRGMRDCAGIVAGGQKKRTMPCASPADLLQPEKLLGAGSMDPVHAVAPAAKDGGPEHVITLFFLFQDGVDLLQQRAMSAQQLGRL